MLLSNNGTRILKGHDKVKDFQEQRIVDVANYDSFFSVNDEINVIPYKFSYFVIFAMLYFSFNFGIRFLFFHHIIFVEGK